MSEGSGKPKVVLTEYLDTEAANWLEQRVRLVRSSADDTSTLRRELEDAEGLVVHTYTRVDEELLGSASRLKVVGRAGVGLDKIDLKACRDRGIRVVYTPDANTQAVVEYVFGLLLDALRPRVYMDQPTGSEDFHRWRTEAVGVQLDQLVLGILGVGRIGRRVARVAWAMGIRVICNDLLRPEELNLGSGWPGTFVDKETLWRSADILTIHVDGRGENRHIVDSAVLDQLKPSCLLINTGRGFLIDVPALSNWARKVQALKGMAILDVHDPEPPDEDYPLWKHQNVRLLPHLAARTDIALKNMSWVVKDVVRILDGEDPKWAAV